MFMRSRGWALMLLGAACGGEVAQLALGFATVARGASAVACAAGARGPRGNSARVT